MKALIFLSGSIICLVLSIFIIYNLKNNKENNDSIGNKVFDKTAKMESIFGFIMAIIFFIFFLLGIIQSLGS